MICGSFISASQQGNARGRHIGGNPVPMPFFAAFSRLKGKFEAAGTGAGGHARLAENAALASICRAGAGAWRNRQQAHP